MQFSPFMLLLFASEIFLLSCVVSFSHGDFPWFKPRVLSFGSPAAFVVLLNNVDVFLHEELSILQVALHFIFVWNIESSKINYKMKNKEKYSELCQISKMESFAKIVNGFQSLTIFAKRYILDVWQGSEYASWIISENFV